VCTLYLLYIGLVLPCNMLVEDTDGPSGRGTILQLHWCILFSVTLLHRNSSLQLAGLSRIFQKNTEMTPKREVDIFAARAYFVGSSYPCTFTTYSSSQALSSRKNERFGPRKHKHDYFICPAMSSTTRAKYSFSARTKAPTFTLFRHV